MHIRILLVNLAFLTCSCWVSLWAQNQPFETDLYTIGLWHFNENSGIVAGDSSGNGLHGELQNGVSWDPGGRFEGCASFDHSGTEGQRIYVPDDPLFDISEVITIDAWIYLRPTSDEGFIVSRWNRSSADPKGQFILNIADTNQLKFICANGTQAMGIYVEEDIPFEQWILVSAVFDNGQMALFIDGEQRAYGVAPFTALTSGEFTHDELNIGDHWRDLNYPYTFEGKIDEVRISNISRYLITDVEDDKNDDILPYRFELSQNYPNPFNPATTIEYSIPANSHVTIEVHNVLGQKIRTLVDRDELAGSYTITWNGTNASGKSVAAGIYFYRFRSGDYVKSKKMLLLK